MAGCTRVRAGFGAGIKVVLPLICCVAFKARFSLSEAMRNPLRLWDSYRKSNKSSFTVVNTILAQGMEMGGKREKASSLDILLEWVHRADSWDRNPYFCFPHRKG